MTDTAPTLTLQDIADLAHVRRPVVSMWRKRPRARGQYLPFPEPVETTGGVERFSREAIVDWLARTGRGNNAEAHLDAPALSTPDDVLLEDLVTLLCLRATSGEELADTTAEERTTLANAADPLDRFLRREITATTPTAETLRFIDDLSEASYGAGEALTRLERGRVGRALGVRDLTSEALDLVRAVAEASAQHLDPEGVPLIHSGDSASLTLALVGDFTQLVVAGDEVGDRALRRRAAIRGVETTAEVTSPGLRVLSVVGHEPGPALDAIDDAVIELAPHELAVVIGPASLLCDDLRGEHDHNRAQTLRTGNLAVALRLPRGMWREAHRQALGLWVCSGDGSRQRPLVADLAGLGWRDFDAEDLASDVAAALDTNGARAFRYLRAHDLPMILSSRAPVVPRGVRAVPLPVTEARKYLAKINAATLVTSEPVPGFDVLAEEAAGPMLQRKRSLGELKALKQVRVRRGSRIDAAHADPAGSVEVLSATAVTETIRLDPFDAAQRYPNAARTEPGDVIFTEKPRPTARVDDRGGALVASPSRILHIDPRAGIGPHAAAAIINRLPADAAEWETWSFPILAADQVEQLEAALIAAAGHESALRRHLAGVHDLVGAMIDGVAAGAVTLKTSTDNS